MKLNFKYFALIGLLPFVAACASPKFPTTGTATQYDGLWTAELLSESNNCPKMTSNFEIRYGTAIGIVFDEGRRMAEIWGEIDNNGHLEGLIGQLGIKGASASVNFQGNTANGTWINGKKTCSGSVIARKTVG